jgi:hypothetical protein
MFCAHVAATAYMSQSKCQKIILVLDFRSTLFIESMSDTNTCEIIDINVSVWCLYQCCFIDLICISLYVEEILHTLNYIYKLKYIWKINSSKVLKEMMCNNTDRNKMDDQQKTNDPKRQDR